MVSCEQKNGISHLTNAHIPLASLCSPHKKQLRQGQENSDGANGHKIPASGLEVGNAQSLKQGQLADEKCGNKN